MNIKTKLNPNTLTQIEKDCLLKYLNELHDRFSYDGCNDFDSDVESQLSDKIIIHEMGEKFNPTINNFLVEWLIERVKTLEVQFELDNYGTLSYKGDE